MIYGGALASARQRSQKQRYDRYDDTTWGLKNCDWSTRAACVFYYKLRMLVEIVDHESNIKEVEERLNGLFFSNSHLSKSPSAFCGWCSL